MAKKKPPFKRHVARIDVYEVMDARVYEAVAVGTRLRAKAGSGRSWQEAAVKAVCATLTKSGRV